MSENTICLVASARPVAANYAHEKGWQTTVFGWRSDTGRRVVFASDSDDCMGMRDVEFRFLFGSEKTTAEKEARMLIQLGYATLGEN